MRIITLITTAAVIAVSGCVSESDAAGGVTRAEYLALKATVDQQTQTIGTQAQTITTLQGLVSTLRTSQGALANAATRDRLVVAGVPSGVVRVLKHAGVVAQAADEAVIEFTVLGARGGSVVGATAMDVATGATYNASIPVEAAEVAVEEAAAVWYEAEDCSGPAWLLAVPGSFQFVSAFNAAQGLVVRAGSDPATADYLMLRAGTAAKTVEFKSRRIASWVPNSTVSGQCDASVGSANPGPLPAYATEPNDPAVSGVPSGVFGTSAKLVPVAAVEEPPPG